MSPIISVSFDADEFRRSEMEKIELFGRVDTASIHSVASLMVENVVVRLFEVRNTVQRL